MKLEYITCSDMREHNNIYEIIELGERYPIAEFAVQAHPSKFSPSMPRYKWFCELVDKARTRNIHLAMHLNIEYRTELCSYGAVPYPLRRLWEIRRIDGTPVIGRVQVNINGGNDKFRFYANKVADVIHAYSDIKFIMQYTPTQHKRVLRLDKTGEPFALLQDYSGGRGESVGFWIPPVFPNHQMGYSGGLSPDNVVDNLDKINSIMPKKYLTWVDAEGNLQSPNLDGKKLFDTARAKRYLENAYMWQMKNGYQK